jgi:hypothetical protein
MIDHIFGHCYGAPIRDRCSDLLWTVKENLEAFYVMKGFNRKRAHVAPQQHPTLQPLPSFSGTSPHFASPSSAAMNNPRFAALHRASSGLDALNVDFDSLLGTLQGGGPPSVSSAGNGNGMSGVDDYDLFSLGMGGGGGAGAGAGAGANGAGGRDGGAIFVPVDGGGGGEYGTASPGGGMGAWVS